MTATIEVPVKVLQTLVCMADELAQLCDQSSLRELRLRDAEKLLADHFQATTEKKAVQEEQAMANESWGTWG